MRTFRLHDALDTSLASVAQRCLVLASNYSAVTAFVHGFQNCFFFFYFFVNFNLFISRQSLAPIRRKMQLRIRLHSTRTRRCNALAAHRVPPDDRAARDALQHCTLVFAIIYCHCHEIQHLVFRPFMFGL